jgi:hypothetical protein
MPSMAISARKHRAANWSVHEVHEDRPCWRTSTELMYMDVRYVDLASWSLPLVQEHKIADAVIAEKVPF